MQKVRIKFCTRMNSRFLSVTISLASLALMVLEILLLPWGEIQNSTLGSSLSLLSIICSIVSIIAVILSVVTVIRSELMLKKEKERLMVTLSYMNLVKKANRNDEEIELLIDELMRFEMITRKDYVNLRTFNKLTNDGVTISEKETEIESVIDNAKDALIKITDVAQKQAI